ncbi:hypothetical protein RCL1_000198 [Eukaryota sp. TZLM3-RCL]
MSMSFEQIALALPAVNSTRSKPTVFDVSKCKGQTLIAYGSGLNVVVHSDLKTIIYKEHKSPVTCVKIAPNGYYAASGDSSGVLQVFDLVGDENVTTLSRKVLSGSIHDICWDGDSQRASIGAISGHGAPILSCDFRKKRPFRVVTSGEDGLANIYKGPPFSFLNQFSLGAYVNSIKYDPSGSVVACSGSNKQIAFMDGTTGSLLFSSLLPHASPVYSITWEKFDEKTRQGVFWTCSSDKTVKKFTVSLPQNEGETGSLDCVSDLDLTMGINSIEEQVLGVCYHDGYLYAANYSGDLFKISCESLEIKRVVSGHYSTVTSIAVQSNLIASSGNDGSIAFWSFEDHKFKTLGRASRPTDSKVSALSFVDNSLCIAGHGPNLRCVSMSPFEECSVLDLSKFANISTEFSVEDAVFRDDVVFYVTDNRVVYAKGEETLCSIPVRGGRSIAVNRDASLVAVGTTSGKVHIYTIETNSFVESGSVQMTAEVTTLKFSCDNLLACGDASRKIHIFEKKDSWVVRNNQFVFHMGRVNCLDWSPNGQFIVSGGLDGTIFRWNLEAPMARIKTLNAHKMGVTSLVFISNDEVISGGGDGLLRYWKIV